MLAVMLQGAFHAVAAGDPDLEELFQRVNNFLCDRTSPELCAAMFYDVLDPSGRFDFVNAAHPAPMVLHAVGEVDLLRASSNFPLGMFPRVKFTMQSIQLEPGDALMIFSDGVTEAQNSNRDFFGDARLEDLVKKSADLPVHEVCTRMVEAVHNFAGFGPQADHITAVLVRLKRGA